MSIPLRVLIVEDSEDDSLLIARVLERAGYDLTFERVDSPQALRDALFDESWDVVIADHAMPQFNGLQALGLVRESGLDLPFIVVSGMIGEDVAVTAMKAGAHDYVMKDNLARLAPAVRRELREAQGRRARRRAEKALQANQAQNRAFLKRIQRQDATIVRLATHPALAEGQLEEALRVIAQAAAETLGVGRVRICRLSPEGRSLRCLQTFESLSPPQTERSSKALIQVDRYPRFFSALEAGRVIDASDVKSDPRTRALTADLWEPLDVSANLSAPVRLHGEVVGMVSHDHRGGRRDWMPDEVAFAGQVADLVAQAFLNADLRRRAEELAAITRVSREITSTPDLQRVIDSIARHAAELSHSDASGVFAFRPDGRLYIEASYGVRDEFIAAINATGVPPGRGAIGRATAGRCPVQVPDTLTEPNYSYGPLADMEHIRGILAVPMLRDQEVIGGIVLWHRQPRYFARQEVTFLQALAQQCVNAVESARLFEAEARRRREAETLRAAARALSATLDRQRVFELILSELQQVVPYDSASVQQLMGDRLEIIGGHGFPNLEALLGTRFDLAAKDNPNQEVIRTRAPVILDDAPTIYTEFHREPHAQADIHSWLGVPLLFGDHVIGMIALDKQEPGFYTPEHARLALAFAAQAAIALENARLFQKEQRRRREAEVLREASLALGSTLNPDQVLEQLLQQVNRVIPYDGAHVALVENGIARVTTRSGYADLAEQGPVTIPPLPVEETPTLRRMFETRRPHVIPDTWASPGWRRLDDFTWIRSWAGVPIVVRDRVIGFFCLDSGTPGAYSSEQVEFLAAFAGHAAVAVENARVFAQEEQRAKVLARALEKQRELDRLKDQFIQNVSHELRTPLGLIQGYAELLDLGELGDLAPGQKEPIAVIARRARMLGKLVEDFTAILEAERQRPSREPVDLVELVQQLLSDFQVELEQAGLALKAQHPPSLPPVLGDPVHLYRVFDNLLSNARKFTPAGGSITLALRGEEDEAVLEVADTGVGIPKDQLARIFERFYQVDGSMSRRYGGAGLGLALVEEIVAAHGGRVDVESQLGQGTTFRVRLPFAP